MKLVPDVQVTSLLPLFSASEYKQVTSTTVPESTGNVVVVVVFIVSVQSVFSPVHISGRIENSVFEFKPNYTKKLMCLSMLLCKHI